MNVAVFGATGGTGRAVIRDLLAAGHTVTALVRDPSKLAPAPGLAVVPGDATNSADVARAVPGHDAVVVSLGSSQSPFRSLFGARRTTPRNICEAGTRVIVGAMRDAAVLRLVVVTAFGVGDTRDRAPLVAKIFFAVLLREQMADKEKQEAVVKASGLDWTLVQPVGLSDAPASGRPVVGTPGGMGKHRVSRADVAAVVLQALAEGKYVRQTVTVAG
jgi:putative NADH-flavin reductase